MPHAVSYRGRWIVMVRSRSMRNKERRDQRARACLAAQRRTTPKHVRRRDRRRRPHERNGIEHT